MPSHARKDIVRDGEIAVYHTWSRCVQRAWLCGQDPLTGRDYSHRREWIESLLEYQAGLFAIDVGGYHILGNHKHALCRTRPDVAACWAPEELAWRWKSAWPTWHRGRWIAEPTDEAIAKLTADPARIEQIRKNLSSLSWLMARWKEPIARMCNQEMQRRGHFFEQRFGSRLLKDEAEILCCSLYVDVNQVRAGVADSLEGSDYSSIQRRILAWREREARASLEAFQRKQESDQEYRLELEEMERLLTDSWLAPITPHAPLTTSCGEHGPSIQLAATPYPSGVAAEADDCSDDYSGHEDPLPTVPDLDQQPSPSLRESPAEMPAESDAEARPRCVAESCASKARQGAQRRRRQASRTIHQRLRRRQRRRASDQCFLPLPWTEYHRLAEWAATRAAATHDVVAGARAAGASTLWDRPDGRADARPTDTPSSCTRAVHAFGVWLSKTTCEAGGVIAELAASAGLVPLPRGDPSG